MQNIEILQKSRAIEVLINLYNKKEAGLVEIVNLSGGSTSVVNTRLLELKAAGLIVEEKEAKFGGRRLFKLTDDGKKVAKKLADVEKILINITKHLAPVT